MQLAVLAAVVSLVAAAPRPSLLARDEVATTGFYSPPPSVDWNPSSGSASLKSETLDTTALRKAAISHLSANLALGAGVALSPKQSPALELAAPPDHNSFRDASGTYFFYVNQQVDGLEVVNSVATVALDKFGNPVARHSAWVDMAKEKRPSLSRRRAEISATDAVVAAAAALGETLKASSIKASAPDADGKISFTGLSGLVSAETKLYKTATALRKVWVVTMPLKTSYINAFVDKETGKVIGSSDWSSSARPTRDGTRIVKRDTDGSKPPAFVRSSLDDIMERGAARGGKVGLAKRDDKTREPAERGYARGGKVGLTKRDDEPREPIERAPAGNRAILFKRDDKAREPAERGAARGGKVGFNKRDDKPREPIERAPAGNRAILFKRDEESAGEVSGRTGKEILTKRAGNLPNTQYNVIPLGNFDPRKGGFKLVVNPVDAVASPLGWHDTGSGSVSATQGNNVAAFDNSGRSSVLAPQEATDFAFEFIADDIRQDPSEYTDASVTNAFFIANVYHDILSKFGFDEKSGNFQQINLAKQGGKDGDAVLASIQDVSGTDNANFVSPPDGQPGVMRMFVFTSTDPKRDGALENNIVVHELTHGLSNRLTGGPDNANCLQTVEAGGMGEGWSDMVAMTLEFSGKDKRTVNRVIGGYSSNAPAGLRQFVYSTDLNTSPLTYGDIAKDNEVHAVGEIWAAMLFEVYWNMVDKLGFQGGIRDNAKSGKGNTVFLQFLVDAMKLQPCNPTFVQARDAIIKADKLANRGANRCEIIRGFAKRGLGINVVDNGAFVNNFDIPADCE
nr:Fungalysin/Thermolysin Extracellular metalloproteinase 5 [Polyrhizophydium stewartii]